MAKSIWLFRDANYRFVEHARRAYVVSATVLVIGIGAMIVNIFTLGNWLNYGVDFTGGVLVHVAFDQPTEAGELRDALGGSEAPPITEFGAENEFVIRAPLAEGIDINEVAANFSQRIAAAYGEGTFEIVRSDLVGPKVGAELQQKAALAIAFSLAATLIYVAFRFEFRFGVAAVIAAFHDVLVVLGFLAVFRIEVSLTIVAALLTILGYTLNDTIVIFDRIRELLNTKGGRRADQVSLVNRAINETLPRTIITSATTLAVLLSLLLLGGSVIRDFALVLTLGVVVGCYSTVFVASPILLEIQNRWGSGQQTKEKRKRPAEAAAVL